MLLQSLKITNAQGSVLELPLEDPSGGFIVRNVTGLGPVKATLVSTSFANLDGGQYHSSRREPRNIVLTLGLAPDYAVGSVQDLRDQLYTFLMPKTACTFGLSLFDKFSESFIDRVKNWQIDARIESCDPSIFTKDPAIDISLMCYDPDFVDPEAVTVAGETVSDLTENVIAYDGTVDTGAIFRMTLDRDLTDFTIFHRPPDGSLVTIDVSYPFLSLDTIEISSVQGSKYIHLTRAGVESSILYALSPQSGWFRLQPGDNNIRVYATDTVTPYRPETYTIDYTRKYGGL